MKKYENIKTMLLLIIIVLTVGDLKAMTTVIDEMTMAQNSSCCSIGDPVSSCLNPHTISGSFDCNCGRVIEKVKVKYRNVTDNKRENTRIYDYQGNWYITNLDPNKEYSIKVFYKMGGSAFFKSAGTTSAWSACNTSSFTINNSSQSELDICGDEPIIMNGSASANETGYSIAIREVNSSYQGVGNELLKSFNGQVPSNIDLKQYASSNDFPIIGGKKYYVKLITKPAWVEKITILNFLPASIDFTPNATLENGTSNKYVSCVNRNNDFRLVLNTSKSECSTRYFVEISEVDQNLNNIPGTTFSDWITPLSEIPNQLDVKSIYYSNGFSFVQNKNYKIKVAVGFPWADKTIFVKFKPFRDCIAARKDGINKSNRIRN